MVERRNNAAPERRTATPVEANPPSGERGSGSQHAEHVNRLRRHGLAFHMTPNAGREFIERLWDRLSGAGVSRSLTGAGGELSAGEPGTKGRAGQADGQPDRGDRRRDDEEDNRDAHGR